MKHQFLRLIIASIVLCFASNSFASSAKEVQAAVNQGSEEMRRLAQRGAWDGVERQYRKLMKLKNPKISGDTHMLGAQAARGSKKYARIANVIIRLWRAQGVGVGAEASDWLSNLKSNYGRVKVTGKKGKEWTKEGGLPFAPDQADAVRRLMDAMKSKGKFDGWALQATYKSGDKSVTVAASDWSRAEACVKSKLAKKKKVGRCIKRIKKKTFRVK